MKSRYTTPARLTASAFRERWRAAGAGLDCGEEPSAGGGPLASPIDVAGRRLVNRFAIHPMEGWDAEPSGLPSELTRRRWRRFGASGAKLIWGGEAFAVQADGRANPRTSSTWLPTASTWRVGWLPSSDERCVDAHQGCSVKDVDDLVRRSAVDPLGSVRTPRRTDAAPRIACITTTALAAKYGARPTDLPLMTDAELEGDRRTASSPRPRSWPGRVGFDFVDVKCCHGYLLHEMLGACTRPGRVRRERSRTAPGCSGAIVDEHPAGPVPTWRSRVRVSIADVHPFSAGAETTHVGEPQGLGCGTCRTAGRVRRRSPTIPRRTSTSMSRSSSSVCCRDLGIRLVNLSRSARPTTIPTCSVRRPIRRATATCRPRIRCCRVLSDTCWHVRRICREARFPDLLLRRYRLHLPAGVPASRGAVRGGRRGMWTSSGSGGWC